VIYLESDKIYEASLEEIRSIKKTLTYDTVYIHLNQLDSESKRAFIEALASVCAKRDEAVTSVLTGVR
jgi:dihydroneopterin aldolase